MPSKKKADKSDKSSSVSTKSSLNPPKQKSEIQGKGHEKPAPKATTMASAINEKVKAPVKGKGDVGEDASKAKSIAMAKDGQKAANQIGTTAKESVSSKPQKKKHNTKEIEEVVDAMDVDEDEDEDDYVTEEEEEDDDIEEEKDSEEESEDDDDQDEDEDSDNGGVDEEGMTRLMKALGNKGLDELGRTQLIALEEGSDEGEEDESQYASDQNDEELSRSGSEEEEGQSGIAEDAVDEDSEDEDEEREIESEAVTAKEGKKGKTIDKHVEGEDEDEDEEEEHIPLDEAEDVDDDAAVSRRKVVVDNKIALDRIRESIQLDRSLPWTETLTIAYPEKIEVDVDDDLNRELAFYKQALHSANQARSLAHQHKFPFTRPADYFAEMVKSDSHMERIRQRLLDESASLKRSEEKRREREGKKFGKQVQIEKLKERERNKKEFDEKVKGLKRKRKDVLNNQQGGGDDDFDVAVEDAINDRPSKRAKGGDSKAKLPRMARDKKYGFGGAGKRSKQNTKSSTDDFDASKRVGGKFNSTGRKTGRPGKGGATKRPGKSRRIAARSRK